MRTIEISCDQSYQLNATPSKGDNSIPDPVTTHALTPCSPAGKKKSTFSYKFIQIRRRKNERNNFKAIRIY